MNKSVFFYLFLFAFLTVNSQDKIPLNHNVYEQWKQLENPVFSFDGSFISFEINPEKGDGILILVDLKNGKSDTIERGYKAQFSFDSKVMTGMIKAPFDSIRASKRAKKKDDELPADSLFIIDLKTGVTDKIADVRSFSLSQEERNLLVYHHAFISKNNASPEDKTVDENLTESDKKFKALRKKYKLADLVVYDPVDRSSQRFENIVSYSLSKNGNLVGFHQLSPDTALFSVVYALTPGDNVLEICHEGKGIAQQITSDDSGKKMTFLFLEDTARITGAEIYFWEIGKNLAEVIINSSEDALPEKMSVNKYGKLYFSGNSERLYFGSSAWQEKEPEDTLLKDERVSLDVWSWEDQLLQPMQLKRVEKEKKHTRLAYYDLKRKISVQLADSVLREIKTMHKGNGDVMLGIADEHYGKYLSWEGLRYKDIYYVNADNGEKKLLEKKLSANIEFSPFGNYLLYYSRTDSSWYSVNISSAEKHNLTKVTNVNFYNERNDVPMQPGSYGIAGFTKNDEFVLIYDRYDIWKIDPAGMKMPENMTKGKGRKNNTRFRFKNLDEEDYFINLEKPMFLTAFNEETMQAGYYKYFTGKLSELIFSDHDFSGLIKAKEEDVFAFRKGDFKDYNNLYVSGSEMESPKQISDANPQQSNYLWGNVKIVNWLSFNGDQLNGMLYTPEDLDKNKKYPLLVYFYERSSESLNRHRIPSPSRSIINPAFCTSNDYVVFVPDIVYREGYPGQSAYDAVISGTQAMLERYPYIDSGRMGLQGQSWGGYQIAWLITQTNMFRAAMAGAPVSNMTSAYGGVRWSTGMSRMFQYENTQSRIGGTLWEKQNLYLENSPLFHVPQIETPLLIMHNDNDGAVPWYQGIEMFVAMRRLDKPVWMLSYNNEAHNLTKWTNRIDLDIRMMQFFDYYLKDMKIPDWMEKGVPAIRKNKITGRQLLEEALN